MFQVSGYMRVTIRHKNIDITPALQNYIELKIINPARRFLEGGIYQELPILDLEFSRLTRHHRKGKVYYAEANLSLGKTVLRAEVEEEDIRACCDLLEEELKREINGFKNRRAALEKRKARSAKEILHD